MSIKVMSWVWESVDIKAAHKLVLLSLADNANDDGVCWPSITTIARKCGLTDRYVQIIINDLKRAGLIGVTYRKEGTKNKSNVYTVLWCSIVHHPGESGFTTPGELQATTPGESGFTTLMNQDSPDPSVNRKSINHQVEPPAEAVAATAPPIENDTPLKIEMRKMLYDAGIWSPTAHEIADDPLIDKAYLEAKIAEAVRDKVNTKILITRLRNHDPLPLTPEQLDYLDRQRYVTDAYADFVEH